MKYRSFFLFLLLIFFLIGCTNNNSLEKTNTQEILSEKGDIKNDSLSNIGQPCNNHQECITPAAYKMQSNCPFDSLCIENTCRIVCPIPFTLETMECNKNKDCNCINRGKRTLECLCIEKRCYSIEE